MNPSTPPVISYEGSTYQNTFWEKGGRAYEDAVEAVALKRLLPDRGDLMLELGAGAGRNTPRYANYRRIVLVDYSRSQLEQAQQALGSSDRYVYVAADIYRLPFVNALFDGATMIRTLHHMADAPLALCQVRRVMRSPGTFILEYANKLNLKAILRFWLGRQQWNPFNLDPVEFAELNFDFHPKTIRAWLKAANFQVERTLTVSHLRAGWLKRHIPNSMLVALDSLFQYSGALWQLTPSVFHRCAATGSKDETTSGFFQCLQCGGQNLEEDNTVLVCRDCSTKWSTADGIYDFRQPVI